MTEEMRQYAPYPQVLADLVSKLRYRPGWTFELKDIERDPKSTHGGSAGGLTFIGATGTPAHYPFVDRAWEKGTYVGAMDAYKEDTPRPVFFYFPVPAATYNENSWKRWLFDRILEVERHETMEYFRLVTEGDFVKKDGTHTKEYVERPFAPCHGPGDDPSIVHDYATDTQRRTNFRGVTEDL